MGEYFVLVLGNFVLHRHVLELAHVISRVKRIAYTTFRSLVLIDSLAPRVPNLGAEGHR